MEPLVEDPVWQKLFRSQEERSIEDLTSIAGTVRHNVPRLIDTEGASSVLLCGSHLLNLFYQFNWTGPPCPAGMDLKLPFPATPEVLVEWNRQSLEGLSWDGEPSYSLSQHPFLLQLAHLILVENSHLLGMEAVRWSLRCLFTEQRLLEARSSSLWTKISELIEGDLVSLVNSGGLSNSELCELNLEVAHICLFYSQYDQTQRHFTQSEKLANIALKLTGVLGKRTRYQQSNIAQLVLEVTSPTPQSEPTGVQHKLSDVPKDVRLGDDTLLDHITFEEVLAPPPLSCLQQAVVLGQCVHLQKTNPIHRLTSEETEAYLNCALGAPQCWVVQTFSLFLRSELERKARRTVERAMTQLQVLVDSFNTIPKEATSRQHLMYCVPLPPHWVIERELAAILVTMGSMGQALEIYERLQLWEEVTECLCTQGRRGRAEEIVREQLKVKGDTPTLWCLLGDVTEVPECYVRAWEVSNHRSARAQRSLGLFYLRKEKYKESVESLQLSLGVNSLQEGLWFSLGCAASRTEDYSLAIKAFQRCVTLEPDYAEAWNNLASTYIKRKDKVRAFRVYQEALKCNYENWRIWENVLLVSMDIGEFEETVRSYHRLMDLRDKFIDMEVLQHLVGAVVKGTPDRSGQPASRLRKKMGELLGRITTQTTSNANVWKLYSDYHFASESSEDHEKGLLELQKVQRSARLENGWDRDLEKLRGVAELTISYSQATRRLCCERVDRKKSLQSLSSARLALQGVKSRAEEFGVSPNESAMELVRELEGERQRTVELITQLQSGGD